MELLREFEWRDAPTFHVDEDVVVELPDPEGTCLGGGWIAWFRHVPSGSSVLLTRKISEKSEVLFGQVFEIGREYKSKEAEERLEAALHDSAG